MLIKKVLITGITGLLGFALADTNPGYELVGTHQSQSSEKPFYSFATEALDVKDRKKIQKIFKQHKPEVVIHTASIGNVDYCQTHPTEAWECNVLGTENMAFFSQQYGAKFIYISSNAVFDGKNPTYNEESQVNPINYYGTLKAEGEKITQSLKVPHAIVRPILMYGWNHSAGRLNPVTQQINLMERREKIKIVDDIFCNPLFNENCAEAIWSIVKMEKEGIYHIAGANRISRYHFALEIADVFGFNKEDIEPVKNSYFKGIAARPKDTTYSLVKMEKELGIRPLSTKEGLLLMKAKSEKMLKLMG